MQLSGEERVAQAAHPRPFCFSPDFQRDAAVPL
jgi:hypothetical protein